MTTSRSITPLSALALAAALASFAPGGLLRAETPQTFPAVEGLHRPLDQLLELNVRDGFVYYNALRADRANLRRYLAALQRTTADEYGRWGREEQAAFWVNAYNAFVLETVVANYPIRGRSPAYPPGSIRQIPGAFERAMHQAAGRSVTLDAIEKEILPAFADPRLYLALGRGAVGSGRLRSEAYTGARLEAQLEDVAREFVTRSEMFRIDRAANLVSVTPIVGWHEQEFVAAYASKAAGLDERSPIERAVVAFVRPHLLTLEREYLERKAFALKYHELDWRLNDLTGRRR